MATPVESNTSAKDPRGSPGSTNRSSRSRSSGAAWPRPRRSRPARSQRSQLAPRRRKISKSLLEIMVEAKVLTRARWSACSRRAARDQQEVPDPRLSGDPEARQGLDGGRLQGQADERRPGRRHQDPARYPGPEQGIHQAVRARGQDRRQALPQQHRQRHRRRRGRRPLLLRHGVRRGRHHQGLPRQAQDLR